MTGMSRIVNSKLLIVRYVSINLQLIKQMYIKDSVNPELLNVRNAQLYIH